MTGNINQLIMRGGPYAAVLKMMGARTAGHALCACFAAGALNAYEPPTLSHSPRLLPTSLSYISLAGGLVPEFVNPKYADAAKSKFKKPTRLECMMQEHPKVMPSGSIHGYTQFPDWTYSPVKNSVDEARGKLAVGAPGRSAAEGELEYYDAGVNALSGAGVPLDKAAYPPFSVFGFTLREPPHIVLHPNFAVSFAGLTAKLPSPAAVAIAPRSTLVVEGPDVVIESLQLDGALVIKAVPGARVGECGARRLVSRPHATPTVRCSYLSQGRFPYTALSPLPRASPVPVYPLPVCSGARPEGAERGVGAQGAGVGRGGARLSQDPRVQVCQEPLRRRVRVQHAGRVRPGREYALRVKPIRVLRAGVPGARANRDGACGCESL